ncbi:DNA sulfur modification protein DndE [Salinibacter ruber]|jgi:DNA sulfur modification protein DndE|uniref:DNA sulfur modification protein DndE n=1 Tax=Salinibacter ruber TaxID=146919 RepID=UPI002072A999|nr:DNA sulfur modification protein DndE [Salinibacter ruber]
MNFRRMRFTEDISKKLKFLKARTGITPNILCRIGFCMSVETPSIPDPNEFDEYGDREIDRPVLLGTYDPLFVAMIKERCKQDGLNVEDDELYEHFRAHVHRGVALVYKRVKDLPDLKHLMPDPERVPDADVG